MTRTKALWYFALMVVLITSVGALALSSLHIVRSPTLTVTFFDVGQGDAIFIEAPSGTQVLIDGGAHTGVLRNLGKKMGFFDRTIDLVVATHPDQDHIGGLVDVLKRYEVGAVLLTENEQSTPVAEAFMRAVKQEGAVLYYARSGQMYDLGGGPMGSTTLAILFPDRDPKKLESNTASIVAQLRYGESEVMLTGDSPLAIEQYLVSVYGDSLRSDILKAGHHGSRTSSAEEFIEAVRPHTVIFSSGRDNRYGHPHREVRDRIKFFGIKALHTAERGDIICSSNGVVIDCT